MGQWCGAAGCLQQQQKTAAMALEMEGVPMFVPARASHAIAVAEVGALDHAGDTAQMV